MPGHILRDLNWAVCSMHLEKIGLDLAKLSELHSAQSLYRVADMTNVIYLSKLQRFMQLKAAVIAPCLHTKFS